MNEFFKVRCFIFLIIIGKICSAQPFKPIAIVNPELSKEGYYFLTPYKVHRAGQKIPDPIQLILDGHGKVVYYNYKQSLCEIQENKTITSWGGDKFRLLNNSFEVIDSIACVNGVLTDMHDFMVLPNGHYLLLGFEYVVEDFSNKPFFLEKKCVSSKTARVKYNVIQELDAKKNLVFQWSSKNVYKIEDVDFFYLTDTNNVDLTHFNSLDIDEMGNIYASVRNFHEIVKINYATGEIIWRMGGKKNEVEFTNNKVPFLAQHNASYQGKGRLSLFDNGFTNDSLKHFSRAIEFEVSDSSKRATVIWNYINTGKICSEGNGSVQRLKNGNTVINYGKIGKGSSNLTFELLDRKNNKLLQVYFADTMGTYKAVYSEKLPFKLESPPLKVRDDSTLVLKEKYKHYLWNTGEITQSISVKNPGEYCVFVSNDGVAFTRSNLVNIKRVKNQDSK